MNKRFALRIFTLVCLVFFSAPFARAEKRTLEGVVNINTATAEELVLLPGVGPAMAEKILAYRRARPFRTVEELARVKGIGRKTLRKLRPFLSVSGATTATETRTKKPTGGDEGGGADPRGGG